LRFILDVATDAAENRATLRLLDGDGIHLADRPLALADHPAQWAALFDLQGHVRRNARLGPADAQLADAARFLGEHALGAEICARLVAP